MELVFNSGKILLSSLSDLEFKLFTPSHNRLNVCRLLYLKLMKVRFEKQCYMGHDIYIRNRGNLVLGNRCSIGSFTKIWNYAPITIGDDFMAASGLTINSATHDPVTLESRGVEINIGSRVWCGVNVTIIADVNIGDDVVIGAGSVVVKDIPSGCIAAGVPAKRIKDLDRANIKVYRPFNN